MLAKRRFSVCFLTFPRTCSSSGVPCIPQCAAFACGLSDSSVTRYRRRQPPVRSFASRRGVRDHFRPPATNQPSRALYSSSLALPSMLHLRAAFATRTRRVADQGGYLHQVLRRAEECATISDHLRPLDPAGLLVVHFRSRSRRTCTRPKPFDTDASAIVTDPHTTSCAPRRPVQPLATLHTPNSARMFPSNLGMAVLPLSFS
ncbi:hypothetical protein EDB86DRAFT_861664 [Lactarius hatsudake]|nr:hypothetical protein EDB86DRAFT_861664 [Lactarius hatsudake]